MIKRITNDERLTPAQLMAIRERAEKATEGPWEYNMTPFIKTPKTSFVLKGTTEDDALFIAHARQDIPRLHAEIERLRELLNKAYQYGISSEAYQKDEDMRVIYEYIYGGDSE